MEGSVVGKQMLREGKTTCKKTGMVIELDNHDSGQWTRSIKQQKWKKSSEVQVKQI